LTSHLSRFLTGIEIHPAQIGRRAFIDPAWRGHRRDRELGDELHALPRRDPRRTTWNKASATHPRKGVVIARARRCSDRSRSATAPDRSNRWVKEFRPARPQSASPPHHPDEQDKSREEKRRSSAFPLRGHFQGRGRPASKAVQGLLDHSSDLDKRMSDFE